MTSLDKKQIENYIKKDIARRIGRDALSAYDEIVNALAYACTFKNPRRFADMDMNERTWQDLASSITVLELQNVASSLARFTSGNRLFFILGCLTRTYSRRKSARARISRNVATPKRKLKATSFTRTNFPASSGDVSAHVAVNIDPKLKTTAPIPHSWGKGGIIAKLQLNKQRNAPHSPLSR